MILLAERVVRAMADATLVALVCFAALPTAFRACRGIIETHTSALEDSGNTFRGRTAKDKRKKRKTNVAVSFFRALAFFNLF